MNEPINDRLERVSAGTWRGTLWWDARVLNITYDNNEDNSALMPSKRLLRNTMDIMYPIDRLVMQELATGTEELL